MLPYMEKPSQGKTFMIFMVFTFHSTANVIPMNYGLVDQQYKPTEIIQEKLYCE